PVVRWEGVVDYSADDLALAPRVGYGQALPRAKEFLEGHLRAGPRSCEELGRLAREAGISDRTLQRAKDALEVVSEEKGVDGRNGWFWRLANAAADEDPMVRAERRRRQIAEAQKEANARLAWIAEHYGYETPPPAAGEARPAGPGPDR